MKNLLPNMLGAEQAAFVAGRNISDNIMAVHEIVHSMEFSRNRDDPLMIFKIDMEKAYDRLDWNAILSIFDAMNFPAKWCLWIKACITSVSFSLLINGTPTKWLKTNCGIRQGDPLSPYLFILCSQLLTHLLNDCMNRGDIDGF